MLAQIIETLGPDLTLPFKVTASPWAWKSYAVSLLNVMCVLLGNTETFPHSIDQSGLGLEKEMTLLKVMVGICVISM